MKVILKNVRLAYPDLLQPGKKYERFGAEFRFSAESGCKEALENAIDEQGALAFGAKWAKIKTSLHSSGKIFKVKDGTEKGYDEDFFASIHNKARPKLYGPLLDEVTEANNPFYSGCHVNVSLDISAFTNKTGDSVVSTKLLGVQFAGHGEPYASTPTATKADFEPITVGMEVEDL